MITNIYNRISSNSVYRAMKTVIIISILIIPSIIMAQSGGEQGGNLEESIASGKITAKFIGTGGSSGDTILLTVQKTEKAGAETLKLSIPPGTILQSSNPSEQNMVIAGVRGIQIDSQRFTPQSEIILIDNNPITYVLEAYCAELHKGNPSSTTGFALSTLNPKLSSILTEGKKRNLSPQAIQAAIWIVTDKITHEEMNQRFPINKEQWDSAKSIFDSCSKTQQKKEKVSIDSKMFKSSQEKSNDIWVFPNKNYQIYLQKKIEEKSIYDSYMLLLKIELQLYSKTSEIVNGYNLKGLLEYSSSKGYKPFIRSVIINNLDDKSNEASSIGIFHIKVEDVKIFNNLCKAISERFNIKPPYFLNFYISGSNLYVDIDLEKTEKIGIPDPTNIQKTPINTLQPTINALLPTITANINQTDMQNDKNIKLANEHLAIANTLWNEKKYSDAITAAKEALTLKQKSLPHDHPDIKKIQEMIQKAESMITAPDTTPKQIEKMDSKQNTDSPEYEVSLAKSGSIVMSKINPTSLEDEQEKNFSVNISWKSPPPKSGKISEIPDIIYKKTKRVNIEDAEVMIEFDVYEKEKDSYIPKRHNLTGIDKGIYIAKITEDGEISAVVLTNTLEFIQTSFNLEGKGEIHVALFKARTGTEMPKERISRWIVISLEFSKNAKKAGFWTDYQFPALPEIGKFPFR